MVFPLVHLLNVRTISNFSWTGLLKPVRRTIMSPEVRPLTIDGVAHEEPHMSHGGKGKQHASDRGTIWGVTPADNARYLPARTGNERYPCHLD
jgi:hypothetical protein